MRLDKEPPNCSNSPKSPGIMRFGILGVLGDFDVIASALSCHVSILIGNEYITANIK